MYLVKISLFHIGLRSLKDSSDTGACLLLAAGFENFTLAAVSTTKIEAPLRSPANFF